MKNKALVGAAIAIAMAASFFAFNRLQAQSRVHHCAVQTDGDGAMTIRDCFIGEWRR